MITGGGPHLGSITAWRTSFLANAFSPSKAFIEPLSSSTRAKSIGVAQGGLGAGGAGGDGGNRCGTALKAKSIGNHCGGTALLSDWRAAWAVELGLDEIHGLMVLVPVVPRPCQLERGVRRPRVERSEARSGCAALLD